MVVVTKMRITLNGEIVSEELEDVNITKVIKERLCTDDKEVQIKQG